MRGRVSNKVIEAIEEKPVELVVENWSGLSVYRILDLSDIRNPDGD